jgi:hypothetical protein
MKRPSIFPSLPKNLSEQKLRQEIRRRLKISEKLGLIRKQYGSGISGRSDV